MEYPGQFDPKNNIVQLCMKGLMLEASSQPEQALETFTQAWQDAQTDFEKFLVAYHLSRFEKDFEKQILWLKDAERFAQESRDIGAASACITINKQIASCYRMLEHFELQDSFIEKAQKLSDELIDPGPFYHGTRAHLSIGDFLNPGENSNYKEALVMNHIYFTAHINGAGLAAALAKGDQPERIYIVTPTGPYENDPNVTDQKFPGNLTRSYRSTSPLKIIGEETEWLKISEEEVKQWREKIRTLDGHIIN